MGRSLESRLRSYGQRKAPEHGRTIFAYLTTAWDNHCGGGLWLSSARTYKDAIPNELFLLPAIRLHQRTPGDGGAGSYFYWATNARSVWFNERNISSQLGLRWMGPFDSADAGRQTSAIMPLSAVAEPVTALFPFAGGSGDPAFKHSAGTAVGPLAWSCGPGTPVGLMQYGPILATGPTRCDSCNGQTWFNSKRCGLSPLKT